MFVFLLLENKFLILNNFTARSVTFSTSLDLNNLLDLSLTSATNVNLTTAPSLGNNELGMLDIVTDITLNILPICLFIVNIV